MVKKILKVLDASLNLLAQINNELEPMNDEAINREYTFKVTVPVDENSAYLATDNIIEVDDNYFRIVYVRWIHAQDGKLFVEAECNQVAYDLLNYSLESFVEDGTPTDILNTLFSGTSFTVGTVDFSDPVTIAINEATNKRAALIELAKLVGGELKFSKYSISLLERRGEDRGMQIRVGKNLQAITRYEDKRSGELNIAYDIDVLDLAAVEEDVVYDTSVITPQKTDYALDFDGVDDYINFQSRISEITSSGTYTFEAWLYWRGDTGIPDHNIHNVFLNCWNSFDRNGLSIHVELNRIGFQSYDGNYDGRIYTETPLNEWFHVAAVSNSGSKKLYINGVEVGSSGHNYQLYRAGFRVSTGQIVGGNGTGPFNGLMDDVRVWDTARTQEQIQSNMNNTLNGDEPNLIDLYNFNEGSGTTAIDSAGSNNGTIYGASYVIRGVTPAQVEIIPMPPMSLANTQKIELGDTVKIYDPYINTDVSLRVVELTKNTKMRMNTRLSVANFVPDMGDTITNIQRDTVIKDKLYNNVQIGPEYGFRSTLSNNFSRSTQNGEEISIDLGDGTGDSWTPVFYVKVEGGVAKLYLAGDAIFEGELSAATGTFEGELVAASGTFEGTVSGGRFEGGEIEIGSGDDVFKADSNGIYLGDAVFADAPFRVNMQGQLYASDAYIEGEIVADSGEIGGWTIESDRLSGTGIIDGGEIRGTQITSGSTIDVATDLRVGNNIYLGDQSSGTTKTINISNGPGVSARMSYLSGDVSWTLDGDFNINPDGDVYVTSTLRPTSIRCDSIATISGVPYVTDIDLNNYYTKSESNSRYYTKSQADSEFIEAGTGGSKTINYINASDTGLVVWFTDGSNATILYD